MYIIAEIGINWDGDLKILESMVKDAKKAGADGVKLQYLKPDSMYPAKAMYQLPEGKKNINKYLKNYVLSVDDLKKIRELTKELNLLFGCTVVDVQSVTEVEPYIDFFKVASSSLNFVQLHEEINKTRKHSIVSTGGAKPHEINKVIRYYNKSKLTLLHCNYEYPVDLENINLKKIVNFDGQDVKYGFSNHSMDFEIVGPMCTAMGCDYFETHVTHLSKRKKTGDHHFALTFEELKKLCEIIRKSEKALGQKQAGLTNKEQELRDFCYRKAFAKNPIFKNSRIKKEDIAWLRNSGKPGIGFDPEEEYLIVNKVLRRDIKKDGKILKEDLF